MVEFKGSRLEKNKDDLVTRKTVFLGVLTVLSVMAVIVFGLPLLVKLSILLGQGRRNEEEEEKILPPLAPRLVVPFEATNSARIAVSGLAEPGVMVELLKNDIAIDQKQVSEDGEFVFNLVDLSDGENIFGAVAISEDGGSSEISKPLAVVFDNVAPRVEMVNPVEEKLVVDYDDFDIEGRSEPGVSVMINGRVAMVDDDGAFKLKMQLQMGKNEFEIKVRDMAGNEVVKKIEITFDI